MTNDERQNIEIITLEEQKEIIKWISENHQTFLIVNINSYKLKFDYGTIPYIFMKVRERIIQLERLEDISKEERNINLFYKNVISYMCNGSSLKTHKDQKYKGFSFVKYIVYIQLPEVGGLPIYNNILYKVRERTYLECEASKHFHSCQDVSGDKPRIVLTFGFLI